MRATAVPSVIRLPIQLAAKERRDRRTGVITLLAVATALPMFSAVAQAQPAADTTLRAAPRVRANHGGFRMEGAAEVDLVFGDVSVYRAMLDRVHVLETAMEMTRRSFARNSRIALAVLSQSQRRTCPSDAVAPAYARSVRERNTYETLGAELTRKRSAIVELDRIGDSAALTPDYRWRFNRVQGIYRAALVDLREMRLVADHELPRELRRRRCSAASLLSLGASRAVKDGRLPMNPLPKARKRYRKQAALNTAPAAPIAFVVDNSRCDEALSVTIDGERRADVASRGRGILRTTPGRHRICLLPVTRKSQCGEQGTVRHAFIYDGWRISLYCRKAPSLQLSRAPSN